MIKIRVTRRAIGVIGLPGVAIGMFDSEFGRPDPKAHIIRSRVRGKQFWDGIVRFYDIPESAPDTIILRIGFLGRLLDFMHRHELEYELDDKDAAYTPPPYVDFVECDDFAFDPIQVEACKALLNSRVAALELAVSSGKTEIFLNAVCCYLKANKGSRFLIVVPSRNLMRQTYKRVSDRIPALLKWVGMFGDGEVPKDENRVIISTIASATKFANALGRLDGIMIDEAHKSKTKSVVQLIDAVQWRVLWACSGKLTYLNDEISELSLERILGKPKYAGAVKSRHSPVSVVMHHFGTAVRARPGQALSTSVKNGVKVVFKYEPDGDWITGVWRGENPDGTVDEDLCDEDGKPIQALFGIWDGDRRVKDPPAEFTVYYTCSDIGIMENKQRNLWGVRLMAECERAGEPYLATVTRLRHAKKLYRLALKNGLSVAIVSGETSGVKQAATTDRLRTGEVAGIIAVYSTMSEGVDVPNLVHLIKLDGIASEQVLTQQLGRVRRICKGKNRGYLHLPSDDHLAYLRDKASSVVGYYSAMGETIEHRD